MMKNSFSKKIIAGSSTKESIKHDLAVLKQLDPKDPASYRTLQETPLATLKKLDAQLQEKLHEIKSARQAISDIHGFDFIMDVEMDQQFGFSRFIINSVLTASVREKVEKMARKEKVDQNIAFTKWNELCEARTKEALDIIAYTASNRKPPENYTQYFTKKELMSALMTILQCQVRMLEADRFFIKDIKPQKQRLLAKLYNSEKLLKSEEDVLFGEKYPLYIREVTDLLYKYVFGRKGRLFILGDSIDRGPAPDLLIDLFMKKMEQGYDIKYVWGNHDILQMGAAIGCEPMVIECMRIAMRYENKEFLVDRMDLDLSPLDELLLTEYGLSKEELYGPDAKKPDAKTNPKSALFAWREHALHVIQEKLAQKMISEFKDVLQMEDRLLLPDLKKAIAPGSMEYDTAGDLTMIYKGAPTALRNRFYPTIAAVDDPYELTKGEKAVLKSFSEQLSDNTVFRKIAEFFFREGAMYRMDDNVLFTHTPPICDKDGVFNTHPLFKGLTGKEMYDYLHNEIKAIGEHYLAHEPQKITMLQKVMLYYLWCGPKSPLFGKDAMKTFEVALFKDKAHHKEHTLFGPKGLKDDRVLDAILNEFGAKAIVYGHTPTNKKDEIVMGNGRATNVDSGFIKDHPGRSVIITATGAYLIEQVIPETEMAQYRKREIELTKDKIIDITVTTLKEWDEPRRFEKMPESQQKRDLKALVTTIIQERETTATKKPE